MAEDKSKFTIKISDEYCEHEYEFQLYDSYSIDMIAGKISKSLKHPKPKSRFIQSFVKRVK